jgi:23S rRNA (pseudouridine1915-N3)-methyltransferase
MRVTIAAVGRLRAGPERELVDDYLRRFERAGRVNGLGPARVVEVEDRKRGGPASEADLLRAALPGGSAIVALDERGKALSSPAFAELLQARADSGTRDLGFLIGGADGLADEVRAQACLLLSFGPMVWPHMLARVMLSEQLYRAASILAGSPYHRA